MNGVSVSAGPGSAEDWLRHARADLALAEAPLPAGALAELLCFHAQQAAEKPMKAVLLQLGVEPSRTHSLGRLVDLLPETAPRIPDLESLARLTPFAVEMRYPGASEPVAEDELNEARIMARNVVAWASRIIEAAG